MSTGKRIVFTGGSGKAGRHAIPHLLTRGHRILNLDLHPLSHPSVLDLRTDLTDSGQCFNALTSNFSFSDYDNPSPPGPPDAVIHFAAHARNLLVPDHVCFAANVAATYNIVEAACKLGVRKIVIASSETVYGACFAQGESPGYKSFPLDEETYDCDPEDSYALSKLCGERVGRGFAKRFPGTDIYALRIGNVVEPHEYARDFPGYLREPETRRRNAWSYVDARDLGEICERCVRTDGLGWQVFNATNDGITTEVPTREWLARACPGTEVTREMGEWEAPLSNRKAREVLGFREEHDWRKYYKP